MLRDYCEVFSCGQAKYIFFILPKRPLKKATTRCQNVIVQVSFFSAVTVVPSRLVISAFIVTLSGKEICVNPLQLLKELTPICSVPPKSISSIFEYSKAPFPIIFVFFDKKICLTPA